jgi:transcriptional regulator with XRE-family HTH domain/DNA-binding XRE family transcriptional regulator
MTDAVPTRLLVDIVRERFVLHSDAALATFVGVTRSTIYQIRHGEIRLGPLPRLKVLDHIGFVPGRSLVEMVASASLLDRYRARCRAAGYPLPPRASLGAARGSEDAELLDIATHAFQFRRDQDLAAILGLARSTVSAVRTDRAPLGTRPRLRLLRLVEPFDLDAVLAMLDSDEALAQRLLAWPGAAQED